MSGVFPESGRLAGIDYGTVRIGVAITDPGRTLASPLENYNRRSEPADAKFFRDLTAGERIVGYIVGLPVHLSGEESQKSFEAREFGKWLSATTGVPVRYYDERYTSSQAEELLGGARLTKKQRKKRLDMLAAQILLTSYLEAKPGETHHPGALGDD